MSEQDRYGIRPGEVAVEGPVVSDASLQFIGRIRTPFQTRADCPRQGDMEAGPVCTLEIAEKWRPALVGLEKFGFGDVLYWLDQSRRGPGASAARSQQCACWDFCNPVACAPIQLVCRVWP